MPDTVSLPLFPLGAVLFPGERLPLHVFEERYRALMRDRFQDDPIFGVVLTESGFEVGDQPEIHRVGTSARLLAANQFPDGRWAIVVEGANRFKVIESSWDRGYLVAEIRWLCDAAPVSDPTFVVPALVQSFAAYLAALDRDVPGSSTLVGLERELRSLSADDAVGLTYLVAGQLPLNSWHRQRILEVQSSRDRFQVVRDLLRQERILLDRAGATSSLTGHPTAGHSPN